MTEEEITALQSRADELEQENGNLTAERDSLREELEQIRAAAEAAQKEAAEAKKLNFTLARKLDTKPAKTFEETLLDAMGVKK